MKDKRQGMAMFWPYALSDPNMCAYIMQNNLLNMAASQQYPAFAAHHASSPPMTPPMPPPLATSMRHMTPALMTPPQLPAYGLSPSAYAVHGNALQSATDNSLLCNALQQQMQHETLSRGDHMLGMKFPAPELGGRSPAAGHVHTPPEPTWAMYEQGQQRSHSPTNRGTGLQTHVTPSRCGSPDDARTVRSDVKSTTSNKSHTSSSSGHFFRPFDDPR